MIEFRASLLRGVVVHAASLLAIVSIPLVGDWLAGRELQIELWKWLSIFGLFMVFLLGLLRGREVEESFAVIITERDVTGWDAGTAMMPGRARISIPIAEIDWSKTLIGGLRPPVITSLRGARIQVERAHFSGRKRALIRESLKTASLRVNDR